MLRIVFFLNNVLAILIYLFLTIRVSSPVFFLVQDLVSNNIINQV
jgi:hypothetical protein